MNVILFIKKPLTFTSSMVSRTLIRTFILMPINATALFLLQQNVCNSNILHCCDEDAADATCIAASEGSPIP